MTNGEMAEITFRVDPEFGRGSEWMWGERIGADRFRLSNTPWWVRGVSYRDVVFARVRRGRLAYAGVSLRGGHSTCWMVLRVARDAEAFTRQWAKLHDLGCRYEGDGRRTFAIDVPPGADFDLVERLLHAGAVEGTWYYEVAHRAHPACARELIAAWDGPSRRGARSCAPARRNGSGQAPRGDAP